jgi:hypothetical protein
METRVGDALANPRTAIACGFLGWRPTFTPRAFVAA